MSSQPLQLNSQQLQGLKSVLQEEKQWLEEKLESNDHFGLNESLRFQTGELSTNDNHPADLGTEMFERSKDIALNESRERHLTDVTEALHRMDNGKYGLCNTCGTPIPYERLQAVPTTLYCMEHVPDPHASNNRPIEEDLLAPPFGRSSLDELSKQTEFDGEDAWQIVESWGTSNTPAMAEDPNVSNNYDDMEIEADEHVGYVESFESFLATDMYGQHVTVVRNQAYHDYMHSGEGEGLLEPDSDSEIQ
ncbi:TraR/DksA C4-type zinc finger protein [Paenibacillus radicis (ex Xue et al. 2023)]|uniref:TraR/DksA C4-type zinc finger protein n=1 Tax=Paenibacillus radicis (ex Xue et al. 2023) TaxID=2972489 RepID=A0ABT1YP39_9BACL|nr:TraR/DksA C4-type zinc finger protein [Paenibacillus radicis (ex Xue et al. 2023)]MCR8634946.1 TraR/DksA C4-type zinc finger protein [Paenibacillus radicis (ex Xue et al. 2023)]